MTTPAPVKADARNRAFRTFMQGLLVDVATAAVLAIGPSLLNIGSPQFVWSKAYWIAVGGLAAKSVVTAGVSYVMRRVVPPPA